MVTDSGVLMAELDWASGAHSMPEENVEHLAEDSDIHLQRHDRAHLAVAIGAPIQSEVHPVEPPKLSSHPSTDSPN